MKIWTEARLNQLMDELERLIGQCRAIRMSAAEETLTWIKNEIQDGAQEVDDSTIYGFRVRDLVPLASILRAKGVSPKEIEDWRKDLQGLMDFVAEQEMEAHRKMVADVLKGFKGLNEEAGEWFAKNTGSKGEEK